MRKFSVLPIMKDDEGPPINKALTNPDTLKEISAIAMRFVVVVGPRLVLAF